MPRAAAPAFLLAFAPALAPAQEPAPGESAIRESDFRANVSFLASDALQGRKAGQWGSEVAQRFLATRFAALGLEPLGDGGTFLQRFEFGVRDLGPCELTIEKNGTRTPLAPGDAFLPLVGSPDGAFEGDAVFVGYGITAPECAWDDYAGVDVRGRVAVALRHEPFAADSAADAWNGERFTRHAFFAEKARNAARHGAAALIVLPDLATYPKGKGSRRIPGRRFWRSTNPLGNLAELTSALPEEELRKHNVTRAEMGEELHWISQAADSGRRLVLPSAFVEAAAAEALLDPAAAEREILDAKSPRSRPLTGVRIAGRIATTAPRASTANVVGRIRGADPKLAAEHIVLGAHYDHVGEDAEGEVWNGADDNASGCAGILAVAEALRASPPKRSVVLAAFGAEEVALLGSYWFVENPPVPRDSIVSMVNCDMIGRGGDEEMRTNPEEAAGANEVLLCGIGSSPIFDPLVKKANAGIDLELRADDRFFDRSDQAAFYEAGVPILFFNTGEHADYHRATDTADRIHYDKALRVTRLVARCVRRIAELPGRPPFVDAYGTAEVRSESRRKGLLGETPFLERSDL